MRTVAADRQDRLAAFTLSRSRKRLTTAAKRGSAAFEAEVRAVVTDLPAPTRATLPPTGRMVTLAKRVIGGAVLMGETAGPASANGAVTYRLGSATANVTGSVASAPRRSFWSNLLKGGKHAAVGPPESQAPGEEPEPGHFGSTIGPHLVGEHGPKLGEPTVLPQAGGQNDGGVRNWLAAWFGTHRGEIDLHALYKKAIEEFQERSVGSEEAFVSEAGELAARLWFANFDRESGKVRL